MAERSVALLYGRAKGWALAQSWHVRGIVRCTCVEGPHRARRLFRQSRPQSRVLGLYREATHANPVTGKYYRFADTEDSRDQSAFGDREGFMVGVHGLAGLAGWATS